MGFFVLVAVPFQHIHTRSSLWLRRAAVTNLTSCFRKLEVFSNSSREGFVVRRGQACTWRVLASFFPHIPFFDHDETGIPGCSWSEHHDPHKVASTYRRSAVLAWRRQAQHDANPQRASTKTSP